MAKSFTSKRTPNGEAAISDTAEHFHQRLYSLEKHYGRHSPESRDSRLILATIHTVAENYGKVESLLAGHLAVFKENPEANPMRMFWALSLLFEAYANLNRIPEAMRISEEGKSIAKKTDASVKDPFLEALVQQAIALEAEGDFVNRRRGFVVALLTLSWYVSHGFDRSHADDHVRDQLQLLFTSYGLDDEQWEWTVKHAHLTKYDFVGLLSILLNQTGLPPTPLEPMMEREPRVNVVR